MKSDIISVPHDEKVSIFWWHMLYEELENYQHKADGHNNFSLLVFENRRAELVFIENLCIVLYNKIL